MTGTYLCLCGESLQTTQQTEGVHPPNCFFLTSMVCPHFGEHKAGWGGKEALAAGMNDFIK
jgi:hypothetical protein